MKRRDFIKLFERNGWYLECNVSNHDVYEKDGMREPVPRHSEIDENLAKAIIKRRGLK